MTAALVAELRDEADALGFADLGICAPDAIPGAPARLQTFLDTGRHGSMTWMEERRLWRSDPRELWSDARAVIMLADNYGPDRDPLATLSDKDVATISVYARNRDYHDLIKKRLKRLGRWLIDRAGGEIKVFVDTAPVMEKPLAEAAGIGWQGKHTNLVSRSHGNWLFLGAIFTTLDLAPDAGTGAETNPATDTAAKGVGIDHCGSCRRCLDICPTDAFPAPYQLDARRCISYLTIEHKGPVDPALRPFLGNRIYGCDDCLAVCPWNKFASLATETRYHAREDLNAPNLAELAKLDDAAFRTRFSGSPIKRIGRTRFLRNVAYAMGNSANPGHLPALRRLAMEPDPVLSDAAEWAVLRLQTQ